ncbi:MAG: hypothetical protein PHD48_06440 [Alphaproteobacteria bacterium]|nr:hypothetical protein [Alphaproteobacteria bacterium]
MPSERQGLPYDELVAYQYKDGEYRFEHSKTAAEIEEIKQRFR